MTRAASKDTDADIELRRLLDEDTLAGFIMVAGAGSGKTTSLVKALAHIVATRGDKLRVGRQRVACITYTEVAANEIHEDVGHTPLATVSTIHSFLWSLARPFQRDVGRWVQARIDEKIQKLIDKQVGYGARVTEKTRQKDSADLQKLRAQVEVVATLSRFSYGLGSDYAHGVIGHDDVLKMVPQLIMERPLLAQLVARQFPFIFVDESQDTFPFVVECLKHVAKQAPGEVCLGFFGDPMQQIYPTGVGQVPLEEGWARIEKPENFRSRARVLELVNAVRANGDGLVQAAPNRDPAEPEGEAYLFVLPADENRMQNLERVRAWLDQHSTVGNWSRSDVEGGSKVLMIAHRMAARRLGFGCLFDAFNGSGSSSLKQSFEDGSAWPLAPFQDVIEPVCSAAAGSSGEVLAVLRDRSPLLNAGATGTNLRQALASVRAATERLRELAFQPVTLGELLEAASASGLVELDPRLAAFLDPGGPHREVVLEERTAQVLSAMMACSYGEIAGYLDYIKRVSPYSTQHGTKGAEFERVVVVLDDEEGTVPGFSYDKLFGLQELSEVDEANLREGRDSVIERTRRLLYVCVSRARLGVAVVLVAANASTALSALRSGPLGSHVDVRNLADL